MNSDKAFPDPHHDHAQCAEDLLHRAQGLFDAKGLRLTDLRRRVLVEIANSHKALGAYDVLERLAANGPRLAPISVYRAIDALLDVGVVHRLESRNAFFACHTEHSPGRRQLLLVCESCARVAELQGQDVFAAIDVAISEVSFTAERTMVEVSGRCCNCRAGEMEAEQ